MARTPKIVEDRVEQTTCCVVGAGPAGAVLALLLARQGIPVTLLEEHMDFDRDFRGDTIHPSVMQIMDEIGLADRLLQIPHSQVYSLPVQTANGAITLADFRHLKTAQTMDVLWFRLPTKPGDSDQSSGRLAKGHILIFLRRTAPISHDNNASASAVAQPVSLQTEDYWQIGYVIPKGGCQKIHAAGLEALHREVGAMAPEFADRMDYIQEWKQVSVLSVESSRLRRWYCPGLLLIGDAAHVMSAVAGVGINYAIQDAVVAANVLSGHSKRVTWKYVTWLLYSASENGQRALSRDFKISYSAGSSPMYSAPTSQLCSHP